MIAGLILWGHALAALLFGLVAVGQLRNPARAATYATPHAAFVIALFATALWALSSAGIDSRDLATRIAESGRDIAWLAFMGALVRRNRAGGAALVAVYVAAMALAVATAAVATIETLPLISTTLTDLGQVRLAFRMMDAIAALVLVSHLHGIAGPAARGWIRPAVVALGTMWTLDLAVYASAYLADVWPAAMVAARGFGMAGTALVFALAAQRGGDWSLSISRTIAMRSLSVVGVLAYIGITLLLTGIAGALGGEHARILQTAAVFGSTAALLTLLSTPWLRAWAKVKVAKHLFRHRYDYRSEWQRFAETLGAPGAAPLAERVVKALADLTDSPAGLLLVAEGRQIEPGARWNWPDGGGVAGEALVRYLTDSARIVEIDAARCDPDGAEAAMLPAWMLDRDEAWALVPLLRGEALTGAILLARPPVSRALDWEDFDLLRVAGRQAASYLAEDRAHAALAEAARFDEFNRRFAFIIHDIKNLVSGLTLVARNAERHADNPDFRTDMIATLQDSATRMNALLARLSQHSNASPEPVQAIDIGILATRLAATRRAQHRIIVEGGAVALGQVERLERLIGHLLQNAIEASAAGDAVTIRIGATGDRATIDVIDTGPGMTAGFVRDRLFRPFASSKPGGFGIGAYEARELAEGMGGTIEVTSCEGEGTMFRVLLPIAAAWETAA